MRFIVIIFCLVNCLYCFAQNATVGLYKAYEKVEFSRDNLKMYINNCKDSLLNNEINRIITSKGLTDINPSCVVLKNNILLERLYDALQSRKNVRKEVTLINATLYNKNTYFVYIITFSQRKFRIFNRRKAKEKIHIEHLTGKVTFEHKVILEKYADTYIIELSENSSKVISID